METTQKEIRSRRGEKYIYTRTRHICRHRMCSNLITRRRAIAPLLLLLLLLLHLVVILLIDDRVFDVINMDTIGDTIWSLIGIGVISSTDRQRLLVVMLLFEHIIVSGMTVVSRKWIRAWCFRYTCRQRINFDRLINWPWEWKSIGDRRLLLIILFSLSLSLSLCRSGRVDTRVRKQTLLSFYCRCCMVLLQPSGLMSRRRLCG